MDSRLIFGLGVVSGLSVFGRYLVPAIPRPVAWGGFAGGLSLVALSFFPAVKTGPAIVGVLGLMMLAAAISWQLQASVKPIPPMPAPVQPAAALDATLRAETLDRLTRLYILSHDGISVRMAAGLELPPANYLNAELEKQGATWRVRSVKGPEAETYDLH